MQDAAVHSRLQLKAAASVLMHPDSYLNKIVVAFDDGTMQVYVLSVRFVPDTTILTRALTFTNIA